MKTLCRWILSQRSLQIVLVLALYFSFSSFLSENTHRLFYTFSLLIKDLLMWMLPITVLIFIAHTVSSFKHKAPLFVLSLILFETFSNFSSVLYAYASGQFALDFLPKIEAVLPSASFDPLWRLPFVRPSFWSADKGSLIGLVLGGLAAFSTFKTLSDKLSIARNGAQWVLTKIFSRLIPLFVLGFITKIHQTHLFGHMIEHYSLLLFWLIFFLGMYITALFIIGSKGNWKQGFSNMRNLFPAAGLAFSSGCSISTMPWTIEGTSKNLKDPSLAKAIIPATTNIQQIGDCITNALICFILYKNFNGHAPDFATWILFSLVFVMARFATAAVLGGAIFIMLPIYEHYLNFSPEMIALILAFNVILDPIVTSCNVIANGALCKIFENFWGVVLPFARGLFPKWIKEGS